MDANYANEGIDQLSEIISLIKKEPYSRRIILSAWNVKGILFVFFVKVLLICSNFLFDFEGPIF